MSVREQELEAQLSAALETISDLEMQFAITRRSNRILRISNRSLREHLNIAHLNDELMRELCAPDLKITDTTDVEGGLPSTSSS